MVTIVAPLLVCVAGALIYAFVPGKGAELGKIAFFCGLFWLVYALSGKTIRIG